MLNKNDLRNIFHYNSLLLLKCTQEINKNENKKSYNIK